MHSCLDTCELLPMHADIDTVLSLVKLPVLYWHYWWWWPSTWYSRALSVIHNVYST